MIELTNKEIDGLLYPEIDIGESRLQNLGRFGKARLEYLHSQCFLVLLGVLNFRETGRAL